MSLETWTLDPGVISPAFYLNVASIIFALTFVVILLLKDINIAN